MGVPIPGSYEILGLAAPVLVRPVDDVNATIEDVVLEWEPVDGAKTYDLQISPDVNFSDDLHAVTRRHGNAVLTAERPRERPVLLAGTPERRPGNSLDWADVEVWTVQTALARPAQLEYPADNATVGDPFFFQWTGVEHASTYALADQRAQSSSLPRQRHRDVHHRAHDVRAGRWRRLLAGPLGTYYWRIIATDAPGRTVDGEPIVSDAISTPVRRFTYDPTRPEQLSPANGATVTVPTLTWSPVAGAGAYQRDSEFHERRQRRRHLQHARATTLHPARPADRGQDVPLDRSDSEPQPVGFTPDPRCPADLHRGDASAGDRVHPRTRRTCELVDVPLPDTDVDSGCRREQLPGPDSPRGCFLRMDHNGRHLRTTRPARTTPLAGSTRDTYQWMVDRRTTVRTSSARSLSTMTFTILGLTPVIRAAPRHHGNRTRRSRHVLQHRPPGAL